MADLMSTTATFLDGVTLLANGIPDLALVIDSPDCGDDKVAKAGIRSDLFTTLNQPGFPSRQQFTWLTFPDLALGSQAKVLETIRSIDASVHPGAFLLTAGSPVQLTGEYHGLSASRLSEELRKPVVPLLSGSLSGDYLDGFGNALAALLEHLPIEPLPVVPATVGIVGFPFERGEEDHLGNLRELDRLLSGIGLQVTVVAPSGRNVDHLAGLSTVEFLLGFPHGAQAATALAQRLGRPLIQTELPIGLEGTARWLREVAQATGRDQEAEALIGCELARCVPALRRVVRTMFLGRRVAMTIDPYIARSLVPALAEWGVQTVSLNLRTRHLTRLHEVSDRLKQAQVDVVPTHDMTLPGLALQWKHCLGEGLDLIIGTTMERIAQEGDRRPYLELGFPCYVRHALFDSPWMGFRGALWLADRLYNLLSDYRYDHPGSIP